MTLFKWISTKNKNHMYRTPSGMIAEHRLKAQIILGKKLTPKQHVHHFNVAGQSTLIICESNTYHKLLHVRQRAYEETGSPHKRKCHFCTLYDDIDKLSANTDQRLGASTPSYYHKDCNANYQKQRWNRMKGAQNEYTSHR